MKGIVYYKSEYRVAHVADFSPVGFQTVTQTEVFVPTGTKFVPPPGWGCYKANINPAVSGWELQPDGSFERTVTY